MEQTKLTKDMLASGNNKKHRPVNTAPPTANPASDFQVLRQSNSHNVPNPNTSCGLSN